MSRNPEILSHRGPGASVAAIDRLSVGKTRGIAKLHQPDYVPKKKFGFRTINSPSNLKGATGEVSDVAKEAPADPAHAEDANSVENVVIPDTFLASQKV